MMNVIKIIGDTKMQHILATLAFYVKYPTWHSFSSKCKSTQNAIKSLEKRGYLEVDYKLRMAKYTGKVFIN